MESIARTEQHGPAAVVTIDLAEAHNALDRHAMAELAEAVRSAARSPQVRAVILTGAGGRAFCAGFRLGTMDEEAERDPEGTVMAAVAGMIRAVLEAPVPVIAAVEGAAAGGGASLAVAADLVVAGESAYLLLPFGKVGLVPDGGIVQTLAESLGRHRAMDLMLRQRRLSAGEAAQAGLVSEVVPDGSAVATAVTWAEGLAQTPRQALVETKAAVNRRTVDLVEETLAAESRVQAELLRTQEHRARVAAFLGRGR